jgi:hypothetical protein
MAAKTSLPITSPKCLLITPFGGSHEISYPMTI